MSEAVEKAARGQAENMRVFMGAETRADLFALGVAASMTENAEARDKMVELLWQAVELNRADPDDEVSRANLSTAIAALCIAHVPLSESA